MSGKADRYARQAGEGRKCMGLFGKGKKQEDIKEPAGRLGRFRKNRPWCFWGITVSLVSAVIFSSFYGIFRSNAEKYMDSPLESYNNVSWLYQICYLLYRDLCNFQSSEQLDYMDVYLEADEEYKWILDENLLDEYRIFLESGNGEEAETPEDAERILGESGLSRESLENELNKGVSYEVLAELLADFGLEESFLTDFVAEGILDQDFVDGFLAWKSASDAPDENQNDSQAASYSIDWDQCISLQNKLGDLKNYFNELEGSFRHLNNIYNYIIRDNNTGKYITNMPVKEMEYITNMPVKDMDLDFADQYFLLSFTFDGAGNIIIENAFCGNDESLIRRTAGEAVREGDLQEIIASNLSEFQRYVRVKTPVDCTVTFAVPNETWNASHTDSVYVDLDTGASGYSVFRMVYNGNSYIHWAYMDSGLGGILFSTMLLLLLAGIFLPVCGETRPWREERICRISFELLVFLGCVLCGVAGGFVLKIIISVSSGRAGGVISEYLGADGELPAYVLNLCVLTVFFFGCWYLGICARALKEAGLKKYIRQRSLVYRFFPFMKSRITGIYEGLAHMDLTKNSHKVILKLLLGNAVILFVISSLWIGGMAVTFVYTFVLYLILRKYISELQKRYVSLLKAVDEIAKGNLNVTISEDLGVFEPFRAQVFKIQEGLKKAVDMEVKSQRMKAELVTNMSHDLKTPLTAIITYVNLLQEKDVTEDQRREYLETLERKSLRLKSLIEDLFEFSKANSENIILNIMDVDIMNLVKQVAFEMSDKTDASQLDVRINLTDEKVIIPLDSQKTYRIYENLFGNIAKYALPGTRVYVNGFRIDDTVVITLKNISAQEITVSPDELMERFVRGDSSRNTEGSGLGLAIAKSFTELQGGRLALELDGDLFKVTTTWQL